MQNDQSNNRPKSTVLDKIISKSKGDVNLSTFALLISEMVLYTHKRSSNAVEFQTKFSEFGKFIGVRLLELTYYREKKDKREIKFLEQLNFIKKLVWKVNSFLEEKFFMLIYDLLYIKRDQILWDDILFQKVLPNNYPGILNTGLRVSEGKKAQTPKLIDTASSFFVLKIKDYIIEKDPIINRYLPKDRNDYNCAFLNVGIIDAVLNESNFPCKVDLIHGEGCVYYAITFDKSVILREKPADLK